MYKVYISTLVNGNELENPFLASKFVENYNFFEKMAKKNPPLSWSKISNSLQNASFG